MNPHYEQIALKAKHHCEYCHAPEIIFNFAFEIEHIIPISLNGSDIKSNLALSCRSCNLYKSSHVTGITPKEKNEVSLFHPRKDKWAQHFTVNIEDGRIIGLTETGKATIVRLCMNREAQIVARKQWMLLEIFP